MTQRAGAVILADGTALEPGGEPVALVSAGGRTLLQICGEAMDACPEIEAFVVVTAPGVEDRAAALAAGSAKFVGTAPAGATTGESIATGTGHLPSELDVVLVHDAAHPLASPELFARVTRALKDTDVAIPFLPIGDTVKWVEDGRVRETIPRDDLGMLQTPVGFRRDAVGFLRGPAGASRPVGPAHAFAPLLAADLRVATVPGEPANLEVRTIDDVRVVEPLAFRGPGRQP